MIIPGMHRNANANLLRQQKRHVRGSAVQRDSSVERLFQEMGCQVCGVLCICDTNLRTAFVIPI